MAEEEVKFERDDRFSWSPKFLERVSPILCRLQLNSVEDCESVAEMILKSLEQNHEKNGFFNSIKQCEKEVNDLMKV
jgi:hypothetical protein